MLVFDLTFLLECFPYIEQTICYIYTSEDEVIECVRSKNNDIPACKVFIVFAAFSNVWLDFIAHEVGFVLVCVGKHDYTMLFNLDVSCLLLKKQN